MKPKILIITRNLPPLIGGMERLNWHISNELSKEHRVFLLSHHQARQTAPLKVIFYGVNLNPLPLFLILAFFKTFWICIIQRPDILFAGSGLTAPIATFWAKFFRKKSIIYIHGLDIDNSSKIYQYFWIPFIKNSDQIIVNSSPTFKLCIEKRIKKNKISIIHPGVTYPPSPVKNNETQKIKTKYNLHDKRILLSIGRLTARKGIKEFIQYSLLHIIHKFPQTILLIIGDTPNQALNKNQQSKADILKLATLLNIENHIRFLGHVNELELNAIFSLADIHVFPVKFIPNDPEGFGMVAIEAAAHGTPTVAFATGGIVDAVQDGKTGYLIENEDYKKLTNIIIQILENKISISEQTCRHYAEKFSWYNLKNKFEKVIEIL